ncbi:hypothetical protein ABK040_015243 [Willaertia magna]
MSNKRFSLVLCILLCFIILSQTIFVVVDVIYGAFIPKLLNERLRNKKKLIKQNFKLLNQPSLLQKQKQYKERENNNYSPVILIGGLGGSALMSERQNAKEPHWWCKSNTGPFQLWASLEEMIPYVTEECLSHDMSLELKRVNFSLQNSAFLLTQQDDGVLIYGKDLGGLSGVNYITNIEIEKGMYMNTLTSYLMKTANYVPGKSLRALTYDWRLGPAEWKISKRTNSNVKIGGDFENLKELIEETFRLNGNQKVSLLGHSLGGPFIQLFLAGYVTEEWKSKFVKQMISVSGSFDGDVHSPVFYTVGDNYGLPFFLEKTAKEMIHGFGSTHYMSPLVSPYNYPMLIYKNNVTGEIVNYFSNPTDYKKLFSDANITQAWNTFLNEVTSVNDIKFKAPNVTLHCIFGTDIWSATQYKYEGNKQLKDLLYSDMKESVWEKGDGTIPNYSLEICSNFKQSFPVNTYKFSGSTHISIMFEQQLFDKLLEIL